MIQIVTGILGLAGDYFAGKREIKKAEVERETKALTNESDWDMVQATSGKTSNALIYWSVIFSLPMILSFIPFMAPYVDAGFVALAKAPDWYMTCSIALISATVGIRQLLKLKR